MENISLFFLIEAIGTIAFASSGAMTAIRKRLDLLGIIILGETTAVGGLLYWVSSLLWAEVCSGISS